MRGLAIRPGAIGDFVVSLPALECLRRACGYLEVWARRPNVGLVRFADRARAIEDTGLDLFGIADPGPRLLAGLRGFDRIYSWYGANRPDFRGLAASLELPFAFYTALPPQGAPAGAKMHAVDFYLHQVCGPGAVADALPRIPCPCAAGGFAAIHPFASSAAKRWPMERFRELAGRIAARMPVCWFAGPEDDLPGAIRIPGLYPLACRLAAARVFIGNDSGISHLAAAAGAPVVALFGPTDPALWAPRGPRVKVIARPSMEGISVDEALAALLSV